jgi:hypothetical protein
MKEEAELFSNHDGKAEHCSTCPATKVVLTFDDEETARKFVGVWNEVHK